jgi:death-on-curing protein
MSLSIDELLYLHTEIIIATGGSDGVLSMERLAAAVARPHTGFGEMEFFPTVFDKAAALMSSIITTHPFVDGNKRTGIAAAGLFLEANGHVLTATQTELEDMAVAVARENPAVDEIAIWLEQHSSPL